MARDDDAPVGQFDPRPLEVLYAKRRWALVCGDALDVLDKIPSRSIDAMVTDPPAGISFMGKDWDGDKGGRDEWIAWLTVRMREAWRVLKPGAHALVWALPRTSHWTATALENAGFEIRDRIAHINAAGFPKSLNVSKEIDRLAGAVRESIGKHPRPCANVDGTTAHGGGYQESPDVTKPATAAAALQGWGSALKPAVEDWWLVRKPLDGSIARNVLKHGTGAINIDGCRVPHVSAADFDAHAAMVAGIKARGGVHGQTVPFNTCDLSGAADASPLGRWPAHLVISHGPDCKRVGTRKVKAAPAWYDTDRQLSAFTGESTSPVHHGDGDGTEVIDAWRCVEGCPVLMLDEQSGNCKTGDLKRARDMGFGGGSADFSERHHAADEGGASRYFTQLPFDPATLEYDPFIFQAKPSTEERERGCRHLPAQNLTGRTPDSAGTDSPRAGAGRKGQRHNNHATVKSIHLMRWLVRLVCPPDGVVLDPFAGSFTTGVACSAERVRVIGVELDPGYCAIGEARLVADAPLFNSARGGAGL